MRKTFLWGGGGGSELYLHHLSLGPWVVWILHGKFCHLACEVICNKKTSFNSWMSRQDWCYTYIPTGSEQMWDMVFVIHANKDLQCDQPQPNNCFREQFLFNLWLQQNMTLKEKILLFSRVFQSRLLLVQESSDGLLSDWSTIMLSSYHLNVDNTKPTFL